MTDDAPALSPAAGRAPKASPPAGSKLTARPGPWVDLGLTLPVFLAYQLGVVFLNVQNASDVVTGLVLQLAEGSRALYLIFTAAIGVVLAGIFTWLGRGQAFRARKFLQIALEGVVYALLMRLGGAYVVGSLFAGKITLGGFPGFIMSMGAGFYEEVTYRVLLFGLGSKLLVWLLTRQKVSVAKGSGFTFKSAMITVAWGLVSAAVFSAVHYIGPLGDPFQLQTFIFRMVLGVFLSLIYAFRGFAAAVWAHALYDVWVLVL